MYLVQPSISSAMTALLVPPLVMLQVHASIEDPSISPTPPMGFNDWSRFECAINQTLFVETTDAMLSRGFLAAGYNRINIDDCWPAHERLPNGSLTWNETLFPQGLPWLANYVHSKGFHFGIYEDAGNATCGGYPGTLGHEQLDAETFQNWGVDYLKLDGCNVFPSTEQRYQDIYGGWHQVLTALQHPLIFSESAPAYFAGTRNNTAWYEVMDWVPLYGELARHSTDIAVYDYYGNDSAKYWDSVMTNYGFEVLLARYQQPGYYNDPDFIIPDWPWLTLDEHKSHFALWASFSAPLIISAWVPGLADEVVEFLTNADIIAIDQDAFGLQATLVSSDDNFDVLTKNLANGDRLLTVLNKGNNTNTTSVSAARIGLVGNGSYTAKDLWTGESSAFTSDFNTTLATHATGIYRISGVDVTIPTGMIFNTASKRCMTAHQNSQVTFTQCDASDAQVWLASEGGSISPLSSPSMCLVQSSSGVALSSCPSENSSGSSTTWTYHVTGNLINGATGQCLQERNRRAKAAACGVELDQQVFALPSGVEVIRGNVI